ncbi:MAG: hypothetical protein NC821_04860 [Candidatus Omnitrophica bacterium]|nr:hypothetical protein [Candidatus Omnitrophota bacterium]
MKKTTYLILLLVLFYPTFLFSSEKEAVFRRIKEISSPEFILSYLKDRQLFSIINVELRHPELQKVLSDLKRAGINKLYFIELPSPDTGKKTLPGAGKNFPEVQKLLRKELGIEIEGEDSGVILLPLYLINEIERKRRIILLHELTHILKDAEAQLGKKEFDYYQNLWRELDNLKIDSSTGEEILTPLEEEFLEELVSTLGNFILMRYLIGREFFSYVHPYLEVKIDNFALRLKGELSLPEKEMLFKLAYFLSVTSFAVYDKPSIWEEKIKEIFKSHLTPQRIDEIMRKVFIPLKTSLKEDPYPNLYLMRKWFFSP